MVEVPVSDQPVINPREAALDPSDSAWIRNDGHDFSSGHWASGKVPSVQTLFLRCLLTKVRAMSGGWFRELVRKATKLTRQSWESAQDAPTTLFEGDAAGVLAEHHELMGWPIDPAMAPVAPVGKIVIWQELLTVDPPGSTRREPGN
jgi:hypothetical protein